MTLKKTLPGSEQVAKLPILRFQMRHKITFKAALTQFPSVVPVALWDRGPRYERIYPTVSSTPVLSSRNSCVVLQTAHQDLVWSAGVMIHFTTTVFNHYYVWWIINCINIYPISTILMIIIFINSGANPGGRGGMRGISPHNLGPSPQYLTYLIPPPKFHLWLLMRHITTSSHPRGLV